MKQMKGKGKTKSEKVRSSLLFTFSLLLFTSAANATEFTINVGEGQTFAYAIDGGELVQTGEEGPAKVTFAANRNATYSFYGVAEDGTVSLIKSVEMTDAGETVNETGNAQVAVDTRATKSIDGSAGAVKVDLTYSGDNWGEGIGGSAAIAVAFDGGAPQPFATDLTGAGTVAWNPKFGGTYVFQHTAGGVTETVTFKAVRFPGEIDNPWEIGADDAAAVTAYVKGGYLHLTGAGEVKEFGGDGAPWAILTDMLVGIGPLSKGIVIPASVLATLPISAKGGAEPPAPPPGAVMTWDALTNAVATAESGAEIAVGADITEAGGVLTVKKGQKVKILPYGKTVTCRGVAVQGELAVGAEDDAIGKIVTAEGAKLSRSGSVTLLGGPMRGTFTVASQGLVLLFK